MRAEFDSNGALNIAPESNAEAMAIELFLSKKGSILYHPFRFDRKKVWRRVGV